MNGTTAEMMGGQQEQIRMVSLGSTMSQALVKAEADDWSSRMIMAAVNESRTIEEISERQGIPLSTCYRRMRELVDEGLVIVERIVITPAGKRYALYRSCFKSFQVSVSASGVNVKGELNEDVAEKVRSKWFSITYDSSRNEVS